MASARQANSSTAAHDTLLLKANSLDDASNFADFEKRIKEVGNFMDHFRINFLLVLKAEEKLQ